MNSLFSIYCFPTMKKYRLIILVVCHKGYILLAGGDSWGIYTLYSYCIVTLELSTCNGIFIKS